MNKELEEISDFVKNSKNKNIILAGDFNTSPYSYYFKQFTNKIKDSLNNATKNKGFLTTWYHEKIPLNTQIDYIFYSKNLINTNLQSKWTKGADHKGIFAEFKF